MPLPPPHPPLFPYTTLFRSPERAAFSHLALDADRAAVQLDQPPRQRQPQSRPFILPARGRVELGEFLKQLGRSESTRLNSSHVAIWYAVFCLKKKNENDNRI